MAKLKEFREKIGLSQTQLAEEMCISVRTLQAYEQGKRDFTGAKLDTILKACVILKCSLEDLFEDEEDLLNLLEKYKKQQ